MTLRITTPVPLPEIVAMLATGDRPMKPRARAIVAGSAILQGARSESIGFWEGDELIALVTLYPLEPERAGEDLRELSFACRPAAARHLCGIIHHARLTRAHLAKDQALRIRATVAKGHEPGRRLARLTGLSFAGERDRKSVV